MNEPESTPPGSQSVSDGATSGQPELPALPPVERRSGFATVGWFVGFTLIALALYGSVLDGEFVFDDRKLVVENDELWSGAGFDLRIFADRSEDDVRTNFRPVRFASYAIDATLTEWFRGGRHPAGEGSDPDPFFFHLQNILLHGLNAFLLFLIVRRLAGRDRPWGPALAVALLFLVHPVHTESVAYISGRRDVLFVGFYLLGLWCYLRGRTGGRVDGALQPIGVGTIAAVVACFVLSLLSKEMAATFPVAVLAVELLVARGRGESVRVPWPTLGALAVTLVVIVGGLLATADPGGDAGYWGGSWSDAFWTAARASWRYVGLFFFPDPLTVDYSYDSIAASSGPLQPWTGVLSLVGIVAALGVAVWAWRRGWTAVAVGIPLFYLLASPVSQIVLPHPERFAERYLYLPSLALLLVLGGIVAPLGRTARTLAYGLVVVAVPFMVIHAHHRLDDWRTGEALWASAIEVHPRCARAQYAAAFWAQKRGDRAKALERTSEAAAILAEVEDRNALQQGYFLQAWTMRVSLLAQSATVDAMELALREMSELEEEVDTDGRRLADDPVLRFERMKLETRLARMDEARATAESVLTLDAPAAIAFEVNLFLAGYHEGRREIEAAWRAIEAAGPFAETPKQKGRWFFQRGLHFEAQERYADARENFAQAALAVGRDGNWVSARYKEAEALERSGDREGSTAVLRSILESRPNHWASVLTLASFDLEADRLDEAKEALTRVLAVDPSNAEAKRLVKNLAIRVASAKQEATARSPKVTLEARIALGRKFLDEGELAKARTALVEADALPDGDDQHALRLELYLSLGELEAREGNWSEAAVGYRRHLDRATVEERSAAILQYGECVRRLGKPESALEELTEAWRAGVRHPKLAKNLGGLALEAGRPKAARAWYRRYLEQPLPPREKAQIERVLEQIGEHVGSPREGGD